MFNIITIIKPTMIPSIRRVREELLFCEPNPIRLSGVVAGGGGGGGGGRGPCPPKKVHYIKVHKISIFGPIYDVVQPRKSLLSAGPPE